MGRWGEGLFDGEMAWDLVGDMSEMVGLDLRSIDYPEDEWEEGHPPIMNSQDARAYLNDGNFDLVFDHLKKHRQYYYTLLLVGVCMRVGVCMSRSQLRYIRQIYKKADPDGFFQFHKQFELAIEEYKCGEPYYLRDFDEAGNLLPDRNAKIDDISVSKGQDDANTTGQKRKASSDESDDSERPNAKIRRPNVTDN